MVEPLSRLGDWYWGENALVTLKTPRNSWAFSLDTLAFTASMDRSLDAAHSMRPSIISSCFLIALASPLSAGAQCPVSFSDIERAAEAHDWGARESRITHARLIEIEAMVSSAEHEHRVTLVRTPVGTVGCRRSDESDCAPLAAIGLADTSAGDWMDILMAHKQSGDGISQRLPGSGQIWNIPISAVRDDSFMKYSNWAFNPEIGFPMPQAIDIQQNGKNFNIQIKRFLLEPQ